MSQKKVIAVIGATGAQGGGLVRAIASDKAGAFAARAITRNPASDKARAIAALGVEVVAGDADHPATLEAAFAGAHGAFCVTNFWEHFSAEREGRQAQAMAHASRKAGVRHVVWSTLEDTRAFIPLTDPRMPVLQERFNVPHFDSKGQMDAVFRDEGAPTSFLHVAFYWDNFVSFGMGPRRGDDGRLVLALPLGGRTASSAAVSQRPARSSASRAKCCQDPRWPRKWAVCSGRPSTFSTFRLIRIASSVFRAPKTSPTCSRCRRSSATSS
jgi:uncharacterized protein YbjT (DUF2867 family)